MTRHTNGKFASKRPYKMYLVLTVIIIALGSLWTAQAETPGVYTASSTPVFVLKAESEFDKRVAKMLKSEEVQAIALNAAKSKVKAEMAEEKRKEAQKLVEQAGTRYDEATALAKESTVYQSRSQLGITDEQIDKMLATTSTSTKRK